VASPIERRGPQAATTRTPLEDSFYDSLAATLQGAISRGKKSLLLTSSGQGEGKSTVTAGLGLALARTGHQSVVLVDTDRFRPTLHRLMGLENRRGLGELIKDLYHLKIDRETPDQFGIGDWIDILRAQCRSGYLRVADGCESFSVLFHRGRIVNIQMPRRPDGLRIGELLVEGGTISEEQRTNALSLQAASHRVLGEVLQGLGYLDSETLRGALGIQLRESLRRLLTLARPECTFTETADAYLPVAASQNAGAPLGEAGDELVVGRLAEYLKRPFLSSQIPSYLNDTPVENLKVLTSGIVPYNLTDPRFLIAFQQLLHRLGHIFDVVLLDSPPVALASPAETLAGIADGVVMVVKADGYDAQIVQQAKAQLEAARGTVLGVVLNQVDMRDADPLLYYYGGYRPQPRAGSRLRIGRSRSGSGGI
jgi:Mrp family chromosome partitioning ATPase